MSFLETSIALVSLLTAAPSANEARDQFLDQVAGMGVPFRHTVAAVRPEPATGPKAVDPVPSKMRQASLDWSQKILRPKLASQVAQGKWVGYRNDDHLNEPLVCVPKAAEQSFVWADLGGVAVLLFDFESKTALPDKAAADAFVDQFLGDTFLVTEDLRKATRSYLKQPVEANPELWAGNLNNGPGGGTLQREGRPSTGACISGLQPTAASFWFS